MRRGERAGAAAMSEPPRPRLELATSFTFEASHQLPHAPPASKCRRLHGHSWKVEVHVAGELDAETGWVIDYDQIQAACAPLHDALDHRHLNDVEGLENPTSERVALWIWERLAPAVPGLIRIVVHETCTARCTYAGPR
jgi:6-pyruvoyltetrahydropterin/6-carboxytetrahydropterin synthase